MMIKKRLKINDLHVLTGINILLLVFRVSWVLFGNIQLNSDEAQYWLWSRYPDLSYYSKPPMIAYVNYLSTYLLGHTEIGIRINAILIGFILPINKPAGKNWEGMYQTYGKKPEQTAHSYSATTIIFPANWLFMSTISLKPIV